MQENKTAPVLHAQDTTELRGIWREIDKLGWALTAIDLDLDRNGVNELVVGAPSDDEGGEKSGKLLWIYDDERR